MAGYISSNESEASQPESCIRKNNLLGGDTTDNSEVEIMNTGALQWSSATALQPEYNHQPSVRMHSEGYSTQFVCVCVTVF